MRLPTLLAVTTLLSAPAAVRADDVLEAGYDATVTAAGDTAGLATATAALSGDLAYEATFGGADAEPAFVLRAEGAASVRRIEGTVRATGATTRASVTLGPAPLPAGNRDRGRGASFPLSFELAHEGEVAALPRLSDRPDVRRGPFLRQRVAAATRAFRVEYADDGVDERLPADARVVEDRAAGAVDLLSVRGEVEITDQDGARIDAATTVGMFGVVVRFPAVMAGDVLAIEHRVTELPDGRIATTDTGWLVRASAVNEATGARYTVGWGVVLDQQTPVARPRERDHRRLSHVGGLGWFGNPARPSGLGFQYVRQPYVTMAGEPVVEDRVFVEGWRQLRVTRLTGRAFAARARRDLADGPRVDWTAGVELDARREVGAFDVGVHAEGGHGFYAALDGAPPAPSLGARAALTVRRAASHRWFY